MRSGRPALVGAASALLLALALGGCAAAEAGSTLPVAAERGAPVNPFAAGHLQDPRVGALSQASRSAGSPTRILIPSIGVDSSLESLNVDESGRLVAPAEYDLAGWFSGGVVPGAIGPAIIAGHIDSPTAPAVFARLRELADGAEVFVVMSDGSELAFRVTGSVQSPKSNFPTADVYSNVPAAELRLITCAGGFDSAIGHYTDNLVVFAALED